MTVHDLVGIIGVALIVGTYLLLQLDKLGAKGLTYSLANALGAALVLYSLFFRFNLAAFLVEGFWLLISGIGIAGWLRRRRASGGE